MISLYQSWYGFFAVEREKNPPKAVAAQMGDELAVFRRGKT